MPDFRLSETLSVVTSPRVQMLLQDLSENQPNTLLQFWEEVEAEDTPIIEAVDVASATCIVTFLWRAAHDTQQVLLIIDTLTDQYRREDLSHCFMKHIAGTDIWHISYHLRTNLRATYHFYPVDSQQPVLSPGAKTREEWIDILAQTLPDPFNPKSFPSRRGGESLSVLELPHTPIQRWWQAQPAVSTGVLTEHGFQSDILGNTRRIWVYQPASYASDHEPYPLLLLLDGQVWAQTGGIQTTLDNLIAAGEIPPLVAIAIDSLDSDTRANELTCNPQFIQFLTDELLPWAQNQWTLTTDPAKTIIAGQSFGGLEAAYAGFHAPYRFGNVLSQSGSFWWKEDDPHNADNEWLIRQFAVTPKLSLRFYVEVGWQEWMMLAPNRHLRDTLLAKGYPVIYNEYNGGHDYICWRGGIADGLIALTRSWNEAAETDGIPPSISQIRVTPRSTIPPQKPKLPPPEVVESPRMQVLKIALANGDQALADDFWAAVATECTPLLELLEHDPDHAIVTFLWCGSKDLKQVILLANKFTDASVFDASVMEHIPQSDIWYQSYRVRSDWRASYKLAPIQEATQNHELGAYVARLVERAVSVGSPVPRPILERWWSAVEQALPDPFNRRMFNGHSVVELPEAPVQRWLDARPEVPAGAVTEHVLSSETLGNQRRVWVYTPPNYSANNPPYGILILLDGQSWVGEHPIAPTLDNLIAQGELPPLVALLPEALDFETRVREMACYPPFVQFIRDELLTWASSNWHLTGKPEQTIIAGQSLGGLTAAFAGLLAPRRIGNILSQSGSFWWANGSEFDVDSEWLPQQYARMPQQPLRFYIEVGWQEWVLLPPTRHLRNVLEAKGYDVTYNEFNGGHDDVCFRGSIADGLIALTRDWSIAR